jgi:hypothetical protein
MSRLTVLIASLSISAAASGYDILPEYQGFNEAEANRMERPTDLDAEYQTVINSYWPRYAWIRAWPTANRTFETTVGSITNQHFLVYSRAKLEVDLEEKLKFRLAYFEQRDREVDQARHFLELQYEVLPWLAFAAYGEPSHYKRSNDIGTAILVRPNSYWVNRIFYTQHDFTRGAHNDQADVFLGEDPMSLGLAGTFDDDTTFIRYGGRYDRPVAWSLPQEGRIFRYEKTLLYADWGMNFDTKHKTIGIRAQYDSTFKAQSPVGTSTVVDESWKRNRLFTTVYHRRGTDDEDFNWEYSASRASRSWTNGVGQIVMHQSWMPAITARARTIRRPRNSDHVQVSVEGTDFKTFGDLSLTPPNQDHQTVQGRAQFAYEWSFSNGAQLMLAGNFDLDEWITLPTFEGGNAQFRTEF